MRQRRSQRSSTVIRDAARCAVRTVGLLTSRRLHVRELPRLSEARLPDGRTFHVFRQSSCDRPTAGQPVTLAVWFRLWAVPPGASVRRFLFERGCIVNTLLFAGFDGYLVKLWMVAPATSDYAGLYSWASSEEADRYARYITTILRPLSTNDSVGYEVLPDVTLDEYLQRPPAA